MMNQVSTGICITMHGRALRGEQVYETVPGRKFERCSIVAGKCGKEILAPFGYYGTCNSELFLKWVKEMLYIFQFANTYWITSKMDLLRP